MLKSLNARQKHLADIKEAFMKKNQTADNIRGDESEERFRSMVEELKQLGKLPWFRGLARSSASEDWTKGVDFRMRVESESESGFTEFSIAFNVKSSLMGAEKFKKNKADPNIHLIVMNDRMNRRWLSDILNSIYLEEIEKHYHPAPIK
jgi:hypothetical protein